jgi:hypothetical protein
MFEMELIERFPLEIAAETVILMRRLAYIKALVLGVTDTQEIAWRDVSSRERFLEQLCLILDVDSSEYQNQHPPLQ